MPVMIGVDPHKASHTAAALDEHGQLLGQQRIAATLEGYQALRGWAARWPDRRWAVEGARGIGRALAQRLVGDGEQVLDVPAKLAARVRVLSVGHGRKSDPDDAVSVAVAARSVPAPRQVGVEDQAVVLHLLTKRRQDLVAARTQTINRLHRLLMDLVPGGARRNLTAKRAAALLSEVTPTGAPAVTRWQLATELVPNVRQVESRSPRSRRGSRPRSPGPTPACWGCSGWGRCWRPGSWVRSATSADSPASTTSPPTPAPPHWRPQAARSSATGCPGPGTATVRRDRRAEILATTLTPPPEHLGVTHWSSRLLAAELGISHSTVARV
jgi:NAD(P)-dependent dehydrogenase (short-subunit alcohol dehydrogenase family)